MYRSTYIGNVNYKVLLALLKGDQYLGTTVITFELKELPH